MLNRSLLIASVMAMTMTELFPEQRIKSTHSGGNVPPATPTSSRDVAADAIAKAEAKRARKAAKRMADMTPNVQFERARVQAPTTK